VKYECVYVGKNKGGDSITSDSKSDANTVEGRDCEEFVANFSQL
jgi:hypothetical protein